MWLFFRTGTLFLCGWFSGARGSRRFVSRGPWRRSDSFHMPAAVEQLNYSTSSPARIHSERSKQNFCAASQRRAAAASDSSRGSGGSPRCSFLCWKRRECGNVSTHPGEGASSNESPPKFPDHGMSFTLTVKDAFSCSRIRNRIRGKSWKLRRTLLLGEFECVLGNPEFLGFHRE